VSVLFPSVDKGWCLLHLLLVFLLVVVSFVSLIAVSTKVFQRALHLVCICHFSVPLFSSRHLVSMSQQQPAEFAGAVFSSLNSYIEEMSPLALFAWVSVLSCAVGPTLAVLLRGIRACFSIRCCQRGRQRVALAIRRSMAESVEQALSDPVALSRIARSPLVQDAALEAIVGAVHRPEFLGVAQDAAIRLMAQPEVQEAAARVVAPIVQTSFAGQCVDRFHAWFASLGISVMEAGAVILATIMVARAIWVQLYKRSQRELKSLKEKTLFQVLDLFALCVIIPYLFTSGLSGFTTAWSASRRYLSMIGGAIAAYHGACFLFGDSLPLAFSDEIREVELAVDELQARVKKVQEKEGKKSEAGEGEEKIDVSIPPPPEEVKADVEVPAAVQAFADQPISSEERAVLRRLNALRAESSRTMHVFPGAAHNVSPSRGVAVRARDAVLADYAASQRSVEERAAVANGPPSKLEQCARKLKNVLMGQKPWVYGLVCLALLVVCVVAWKLAARKKVRKEGYRSKMRNKMKRYANGVFRKNHWIPSGDSLDNDDIYMLDRADNTRKALEVVDEWIEQNIDALFDDFSGVALTFEDFIRAKHKGVVTYSADKSVKKAVPIFDDLGGGSEARKKESILVAAIIAAAQKVKAVAVPVATVPVAAVAAPVATAVVAAATPAVVVVPEEKSKSKAAKGVAKVKRALDAKCAHCNQPWHSGRVCDAMPDVMKAKLQKKPGKEAMITGKPFPSVQESIGTIQTKTGWSNATAIWNGIVTSEHVFRAGETEATLRYHVKGKLISWTVKRSECKLIRYDTLLCPRSREAEEVPQLKAHIGAKEGVRMSIMAFANEKAFTLNRPSHDTDVVRAVTGGGATDCTILGTKANTIAGYCGAPWIDEHGRVIGFHNHTDGIRQNYGIAVDAAMVSAANGSGLPSVLSAVESGN